MCRRAAADDGWPARIDWLDSRSGLDAALIRLDDVGRWPQPATVVRWGRIAGSDAVSAAAVGYPSAQEQPDTSRDTEHVIGFVPPGTGRHTDRYHLTVQTSTLVTRPGRRSAWAGVSGAALIPKQRKRKLTPWTSEEARRFLEIRSIRLRSAFTRHTYWFWFSAFVKGEVLGLAWEAGDFEQGALIPDHQLQIVRRSLLYRETKTEASDAWLPMPAIVSAALMIRRTQQDGERESAGEIWQQTRDMPSLIFTGRFGTPVDPRTLNRKFTARCEPRECVRSLFMTPGIPVPRCSSIWMCIRR